MSTLSGAVRTHLMASNPQFQRLFQEHAHYAALLDEIASKQHLTEHDQLEEIRIKKIKLKLKDEMETIVHKADSA